MTKSERLLFRSAMLCSHRPRMLRMALFLALCLLMGSTPVHLFAQETKQEAAELQAPIVDWSHVKQAHRIAESWARQGRVGDLGTADHIWVTGISGVRVTLRMDGVELGLGDAIVKGKTTAGPRVDLMPLVADAMRGALQATSRELIDRHRRALDAIGKNAGDGPGPLTLADVGPELLVDLQVGRELERVTLASDASITELLGSFDPGIDGLRLAGAGPDGHMRAAMVWPATALASNISPESQLRQLAAAVAGTHGKLSEIARPGGMMLHKFETVHVVRPSLAQPVHLIRGNTPIPRTPLDGATLDSVSQRMARYMLEQVRENGTLPGAYEPTSDRFEGELATYKSQGLAIYAFVKWSELLGQMGGREDERRRVNLAVQAMAGSLSDQLDIGSGVPDPPAMALLAMSILESPVLVHQKLDRDNLIASLLRVQNASGAFRQTYDEKSGLLRPADQALVLAALTEHADRTRDPVSVSAVRLGRKWLWSQVKPSHSEETWYWLSQVERTINQNNLPVFMSAAEESDRFDFMRQLSVTLAARQVVQVEPGAPTDVIGGFVKMNELWPDWQSAWSAGYLAWAVRSNVAPQERQIQLLLSSALGARFIARLMFDWPSCFYVARPEEVVGGVRGSLIDNRLSIRYTAAGLLAAIELQQTLRDAEQQQGMNP